MESIIELRKRSAFKAHRELKKGVYTCEG